MRRACCVRRISLVPALLCAVLLAACGGSGEGVPELEQNDPRFLDAQQLYLREGRKQEALTAFVELTRKRDYAPESHLYAGQIYLEEFKEPILAIYHFRQYLDQEPQGTHAGKVRSWIDTARKEFMKGLPSQPYRDRLERLNLQETIERLQTEKRDLESELRTERDKVDRLSQALDQMLAQQPSQVSPGLSAGGLAPALPPGAPAAATPVPQPDFPQTALPPGGRAPAAYEVQTGDTLTGIARIVYGDGNQWRRILEANEDLLPSPNALRPGMRLRIPR
ncbi:MAG: LysM peptidoglycan-binding domain-containing protein [Opitutales bacterium]